MQDNKELFRKKAMERISNPNQLNEYIKVSSPSIWTILIAAIVLLLGLGFWGIFGTMESSIKGIAVVTEGKAVVYVVPEELPSLANGMMVRVSDVQGVVQGSPGAPLQITADFNEYALFLGKLQIGDWKIPLNVDLTLPDGAYEAEVITETIRPIAFLTQ